jgi:hypothetical protein
VKYNGLMWLQRITLSNLTDKLQNANRYLHRTSSSSSCAKRP